MKAMTMVKQKGLSLVETMIALTLGAIVTVGIVQLFVANSETYNLLQGQSRMQESARFGLNFLSRGIQMAGYKGCYSENEEVYSVAQDPDGIPYEFDVREGLFAHEGFGGGGGWSTALDANGITTLPDDVNDDSYGGNPIPVNDIVPGTDVLTIRRTSSTEYPLSADLLDSSDPVVVDTADPAFSVGDMALIHDCEKSTIFRITDLTINTGQAETTIEHLNAKPDFEPAVRPFDNEFQQLAEFNTYDADAAVSPIEAEIYYIAPGGGVNNQGDSPLSLWRKAGTGPPVELIEGVENLKVLFGEDTDDDGVPNVYSLASGIVDYSDVITVRLSITVNSVDDVGGDSEPSHGCVWDGGEQACFDGEKRDGLIRRTFHETVQVRNKG